MTVYRLNSITLLMPDYMSDEQIDWFDDFIGNLPDEDQLAFCKLIDPGTDWV